MAEMRGTVAPQYRRVSARLGLSQLEGPDSLVMSIMHMEDYWEGLLEVGASDNGDIPTAMVAGFLLGAKRGELLNDDAFMRDFGDLMIDAHRFWMAHGGLGSLLDDGKGVSPKPAKE